MSHEPSILVIGLGNPLRGDDGIGWYAVDRISELTEAGDIEFLKCRELMPEISERVSKVKRVLFLDAAVGTERGKVTEKQVYSSEEYPPLATHHLDPAGLLAFSKALYGSAPRAVVMTVSGESFEYHNGLSEGAQGDARLLVNRACEILDKWLRGKGRSCEDPDCRLISFLNGSNISPA